MTKKDYPYVTAATGPDGPYGTDITGSSWGTVDTRNQTWLSWGHATRKEAARPGLDRLFAKKWPNGTVLTRAQLDEARDA